MIKSKTAQSRNRPFSRNIISQQCKLVRVQTGLSPQTDLLKLRTLFELRQPTHHRQQRAQLKFMQKSKGPRKSSEISKSRMQNINFYPMPYPGYYQSTTNFYDKKIYLKGKPRSSPKKTAQSQVCPRMKLHLGSKPVLFKKLKRCSLLGQRNKTMKSSDREQTSQMPLNKQQMMRELFKILRKNGMSESNKRFHFYFKKDVDYQ